MMAGSLKRNGKNCFTRNQGSSCCNPAIRKKMGSDAAKDLGTLCFGSTQKRRLETKMQTCFTGELEHCFDFSLSLSTSRLMSLVEWSVTSYK